MDKRHKKVCEPLYETLSEQKMVKCSKKKEPLTKYESCKPCKPCKPEPKCKPCKVVPYCPPSCSESDSSSCSSSTASCKDKCCVPKFVYQACIHGGVASLAIVVTTIQTPNGDTPPTFTCPSAVGQRIYLTFNITNTGNVTIHEPVYIYTSFTGVKRVTCKKLRAEETVTVTVSHKVSRCTCQTGANLSIVANAFTNLKNCLVLTSQPIAIEIPQSA